MALSNSPEQNPRYKQYLNTGVNAVRGSKPTPEIKAKQVTRHVMESYKPDAIRRVDSAYKAYQNGLKDKSPESINPQEKYLRELGKEAEKYTPRRLGLQDKETLRQIDKHIGKKLIKEQGITEQGLAYVLEKHSPAAAMYPQGTKEYAAHMAKICDREAQTPRERMSKEEEKHLYEQFMMLEKLNDHKR